MGVEAQVETRQVLPRLDQRWTLFVWLVVLNVLDVITTGLVLDRGGRETNPFVQPIVDSLAAVSLLKAAALLVVGVLLSRCRPSRVIDLALTATTGWYIAVVVWNSTVLALI